MMRSGTTKYQGRTAKKDLVDPGNPNQARSPATAADPTIPRSASAPELASNNSEEIKPEAKKPEQTPEELLNQEAEFALDLTCDIEIIDDVGSLPIATPKKPTYFLSTRQKRLVYVNGKKTTQIDIANVKNLTEALNLLNLKDKDKDKAALKTNAELAIKQYNNRTLELSIEEAEMIAALDPKDSDITLLKYQQKIALALSYSFARGGKNLASDQWTANKYLLQAAPDTAQAKKDTLARVQTIYSTISWINNTRQFFNRIVAVVSAFGKDMSFLSTIGSTFLKPEHVATMGKIAGVAWKNISRFGGLFNGLTLAVDIGIIIKNVFAPQETEKHLSKFERAKNAFTKNGRASRMFNDSLWFGMSVTTLIISGGTASLAILAGCLVDSIFEIAKSIQATQKYKNLLKKVNDRIEKIDEEITIAAHEIANDLMITRKNLNETHALTLKQLADNNAKIQSTNPKTDGTTLANLLLENNTLKATLANTKSELIKNTLSITEKFKTERPELYFEYKKLHALKPQLEKKVVESIESGWKNVGISIGLMIGFVLMAFPPAGLGYFAIAGISIAIGAVMQLALGSFFSGICKKIYDKATAPAAPAPAPIIAKSGPGPSYKEEHVIDFSSYKQIYRRDASLRVPSGPRPAAADDAAPANQNTAVVATQPQARLSLTIPNTLTSDNETISPKSTSSEDDTTRYVTPQATPISSPAQPGYDTKHTNPEINGSRLVYSH